MDALWRGSWHNQADAEAEAELVYAVSVVVIERVLNNKTAWKESVEWWSERMMRAHRTYGLNWLSVWLLIDLMVAGVFARPKSQNNSSWPNGMEIMQTSREEGENVWVKSINRQVFMEDTQFSSNFIGDAFQVDMVSHREFDRDSMGLLDLDDIFKSICWFNEFFFFRFVQ